MDDFVEHIQDYARRSRTPLINKLPPPITAIQSGKIPGGAK
jgi:hypothetical protein